MHASTLRALSRSISSQKRGGAQSLRSTSRGAQGVWPATGAPENSDSYTAAILVRCAGRGAAAAGQAHDDSAASAADIADEAAGVARAGEPVLRCDGGWVGAGWRAGGAGRRCEARYAPGRRTGGRAVTWRRGASAAAAFQAHT